MQLAEKNGDSATQSGRRGDKDDEVISTTSSVSAEHPVEGQETVSTNNKIENMVEVLHCKVSARTSWSSSMQFSSSPQTSQRDKLAKETTHDLEVNFNKMTPFVKEETAKELQNHSVKTRDT